MEGTSGTTDPAPGTHKYPIKNFATANLSVDPPEAWDHWEGDVTPEQATTYPLPLLMDDHKSVTAVLKSEVTLTMATNGEEDSVTPGVGAHGYLDGDEVDISASPAERFDHWEGDVPEGKANNLAFSLMMDGNKTLTAYFKPDVTLNVTKVGDEGTVSPEGSSSHLQDTEVLVSAGPAERFDYWEGDVPEGEAGNASFDIVMNTNKSLTAHFKPDVTLTVAKIGNGTVNPPEGTKTYIRDENATVSATPAAAFDHWEGDLADATIDGASITIPMTSDKSVTAVFKPEYILTMATEGGGTVSPEESPPTPHVYREGDVVHLSATGNNEWIFDHWTGDVSDPQSATPTITMTEDKTATAHFIEGVLITVNKEGQGTVSPGTGVYPKGGTRTFTASPAEGWRWDRWEGDINGEDQHDASLDLPMDQPRTITAYFIQLVTLTMEKSLVGNLPANGGALSPAVDEEHIYDINTEVTLMASADSGWRFKEWTGGASGTVAPVVLVMDSDKNVTGHFIQQHAVTTEVVINGTIVLTPTGSIFDHGTQVRFDFEEEHSQQPFHHWEGLTDSFSTPEWGAGTSTANPVNVSITDSLHVIGYEEDEIVPLTTHVDAEGCAGCAVDPESAEYVVGSYATVTATAPDGWTFDHWEGQVPGEDVESNPLSLLMNDDKDITAVFYVRLTVTPVAHVTIDEPTVLDEFFSWLYAPGSNIALYSTPDQNYEVNFWRVTKDASGGAKALNGFKSEPEGEAEYLEGEDVNLILLESSTAEPVPHPVSTKQLLVQQGYGGHVVVTFAQEDLVSIKDGQLYEFVEGATVSLEGEPDVAGYVFDEWEGNIIPLAPDANPISLTMNQNRRVKGLFTNELRLEVDVQGEGTVAVDPDQEFYAMEDEVTLTPYPDTENGWFFDHWEGDVPQEDSLADPLLLVMDDHKDVTAVFIQYKLTVTAEGEGKVGVSPPGGDEKTPTFTVTYAGAQEDVALNAIPEPGWGFKEWSGAASGENPSTTVDVGEGNTTVHAVFAQVELSVDAVGEGLVTATPPGGQQAVPFTETYGIHSTTSLSATAAGGWYFDYWEGDLPDGAEETDNPLSLTMNDDKQLTAHFATTQSELYSITFTSDFNVLHDDNGMFGNVGTPFTEPEFEAGSHSYPILCAMDSVLTAEVNLSVFPAGTPFALIGAGAESWTVLQGTGISTGQPQVVEVIASVPMPHVIEACEQTIKWRVEFESLPEEVASSQHTFYYTYGAPQSPSEEATVTRVEYLLQKLAADGGVDCDDYKAVGFRIAKAIEGKFGGLLSQPNDMEHLWPALDDGVFECETGRLLAVNGLTMLGFQREMLRWSCSDGCHALPSTDDTSGPGYRSNCVDVEEPNDWCNNVFCSIEPNPHPAHGVVSGSVFDNGLSGCYTLPGHWALRFGGGGPVGGPVGSPAESFFKIQDIYENWFYITVVPAHGPFPGSIVIGDELDKAGRYAVMEAAQGQYPGQHWFDNNYPASDLP